MASQEGDAERPASELSQADLGEPPQLKTHTVVVVQPTDDAVPGLLAVQPAAHPWVLGPNLTVEPASGTGTAAEEASLLNWRGPVMLLAMADMISTFVNVSLFTYVIISDGTGPYNLLCIVFGFTCFLGPACGLAGAKLLQRSLVSVYFAISLGKVVYHVTLAVSSNKIWHYCIASIQIWGSKTAFGFWHALGRIAPARREQLLAVKAQTVFLGHVVLHVGTWEVGWSGGTSPSLAGGKCA